MASTTAAEGRPGKRNPAYKVVARPLLSQAEATLPFSDCRKKHSRAQMALS